MLSILCYNTAHLGRHCIASIVPSGSCYLVLSMFRSCFSIPKRRRCGACRSLIFISFAGRLTTQIVTFPCSMRATAPQPLNAMIHRLCSCKLSHPKQRHHGITNSLDEARTEVQSTSRGWQWRVTDRRCQACGRHMPELCKVNLFA